LLSRTADVWQILLIDVDITQWPITAGRLDLPCLFRSFIEVCQLSRLCLPFIDEGIIPDVLTSLMELCHFSWQPLLDF